MKRIIAILLCALTLFTLVACGEGTTESSRHSPTNTDKPSTNSSTTGSSSTDEGGGDNIGGGEDGTEFKVFLVFNGAPFTYTGSSPITVTWSDGISYVSSVADKNGVATVRGLDGKYTVSLKGLPAGFTYDPNPYDKEKKEYGHITTSEEPEIEIEIFRIGTTTGAGTTEYNRKVLTKTGVYTATLKNGAQKIFFEFAPTSSGTYTIESWLPVTDDKINPKVDVYTSNSAAPLFLYTLDTGGAQGKNYTKNFKYEVEIADEMISDGGGQVVFIFAIYVTARNERYFPVDVNFAVKYEGGFELDHASSNYVMAEEMYGKMGEAIRVLRDMSWEDFYSTCGSGFNDTEQAMSAYEDLQAMSLVKLKDALSLNILFNKYPFFRLLASTYYRTYVDTFNSQYTGKTWQNPSTTINGRVVLIGTNYRFNEATGFFHKYDEAKYASDPYGYGAGFGPILYADISAATRTGVLDTAFINIEYIGNKALLVENGTEYYKLFIEGYRHAEATSQSVYGGGMELPEEYVNAFGYNDFTNADGAVPVNREVMEFLQKYSVAQVLFMDGDGWAETGTPPYESTEKDQWLFACGYYE